MICLYTGKLSNDRIYNTNIIRKNKNLPLYNFKGLIINNKELDNNKKYNIKNHIKCDISTDLLKIFKNSIDVFISEQVFEHITYDKLEKILNDIYQILKPGGLLRISLPDYRSKELINRTFKFNKSLLNTKETKEGLAFSIFI